MSDGTVINAGAGGDTIATDDIASQKYQRIKLIHGADGVNAGDVSTANGLPVNVVTLPTLTKGTQGSTGISVQDLKDAGRNVTNFFTALPIVTTNAEVMQSLTGYKSGAAVGATVTPAVVTAGKTYRITSIILTYTAVATMGSAIVRFRTNSAAVAVITDPLAFVWTIGTSAATAGVTTERTIEFPDGLELAAGSGFAIGVKGLDATFGNAAVGYVGITVQGYEY